MDAAEGWRLIGRRWVRCAVLNAFAVSSVWLVWEIFLPQGSLLGSAFRFLGLHLAQALFLVAQKIAVQPEEPSSVSTVRMLLGVLSLAWKAAMSKPVDDDTAAQAFFLFQKIRATRDTMILCALTLASGFLSLLTFASSASSVIGTAASFDMGARGAALAACYLVLYIKHKRHILKFPIIQRRVYFSFKLGLPEAVTTSFKTAVIALPVSGVLVRILHLYLTGEWGVFSPWQELVFTVAAFFTSLCWNICCHLIQIIHTRRHVFAPPPGSAAAETNPTGLLLAVLEDDENLLLQYLGYLDAHTLATVSELNVEAWRRAAFFGESGEPYKKLVLLCLRPIDRLTLKLVRCLENSQSGYGDNLNMELLTGGRITEVAIARESFNDLKLCSWCVGIVSSLTAHSRTEDRYGVAQLSGCNAAVLSSLISCLLIVEVYLGKRSSFQAFSFVGPNGIKWPVPFRGAFMDSNRKQDFMPRRRSALQKKAHAMADVLRTAIYSIVTVFKDEMAVGAGSSPGSYTVAERDWLCRSKPLFGTVEMHKQKLMQFLEFQE